MGVELIQKGDSLLDNEGSSDAEYVLIRLIQAGI